MKRSCKGIVASLLTGLTLVTAPLAAQGLPGSQKSPEPAVERPAPTSVTADQPAFETRDQLQRLFRQYPPSLPAVLRLDPSLLTNTQYLGMYPALASFVAHHPEVVHNPAFFIGDPRTGGFQVIDTPGSRAGTRVFVMREILGGLALFMGFVLVMGLTAWGLKTFIDHRRWLQLSKIQTDAHSKLLDRLTSSEDLLAYIQSPAGRQFLEAAPLPAAPQRHTISAPINRILWSVQAGVVLMLGGAGLWASRSFVIEEVAQPLSVLGVLNMFLGAGFVISALFAYGLSKMLGLIDPPALHPHA